MARSDHDESPRSSRRSRKAPRNIPPPAPEVDWTRPADDEPESPRRRRRPEREKYRDRDKSRHRDADWERRRDDEALLRTPESQTSSSSYHLSRRYHDAGSRRERDTTPSQSVASSITSVLTPHPPRSSMTRQANANVIYRRPSVTIRDNSPAQHDEDIPLDTTRNHSRPRLAHVVPVLPLSRRPSRTLQVPEATSSSENDDTEEPYDSPDDRRVRRIYEDSRLISAEESGDDRGDRREPRSYRETRLVRVERIARSPSAEDIRSRSYRPILRARSVRSEEEDNDEMGVRHMPPRHGTDREPPVVRTMSKPASRSRSQPASARYVPDLQSDHEHDADSDEPVTRELQDRFERRKPHKHRHGSRASRDQGRSRNEIHPRRSTRSKRYVLSSALVGVDSGSPRRVRPSSSNIDYKSAPVRALDKQERHRPTAASIRRSNTVIGSVSAAASQHQSVSSSTRRSSSFFGSIFGSSLPGHSHHHAPDKPIKLYDCVVCMDELPARKMARLKCGHRMCNSCLKRSFKLSVTDPQHMPPRCCTAEHIPLKHVERLFDISFKKTWNKKFAEFTARDRIYCPRRSCNEFIRPEDIRHANDGRKYGKCPGCSTKVCLRCSSKLHRERDCPKDEETMEILAKAKEEGWQRCFKCKALVELQEGCNHMTCRCGAEFCYVCGQRWKGCSCPWFNYETVENDRLQHMQIPVPIRERLGDRTTVELPPSPWREGRPVLRSRPQNYEEELTYRRLQEEQDEAYARRLQYSRPFDDDLVGGFGDINGIGNAAGHFMNEDFRSRPRNIAVAPQPPPPPPMPLDPAPMVFERPQQAGDYVQGVNRARGVRANSMTRLADRFNADLRSSPTRPTHAHRAGPPPPLQKSATMPLPTMAPPPLAPGPPARRHAAEEIGMRSVERPSGRITRPVVYEEPEDIAPPQGMAVRKQHVKDPPRTPKQSAMAGLTGDERYRGRVDEWRRYVGECEPAEVGSPT